MVDHFKQEHQMDNDYEKHYQKVLEDYDEAFFEAHCIICPIKKSEENILFFKRHSHCLKEERCQKVVVLHQELLDILKEQQDFRRQVYGQKIFNYYQNLNPLINIKIKHITVSFSELFGTDYNLLDDSLIEALIDLVEYHTSYELII